MAFPSEKETWTQPPSRKPSTTRRTVAWLAALSLTAAYLTISHMAGSSSSDSAVPPPPPNVCVQPAPLFPDPGEDGLLDKAYEHIASSAFRNASIGRLSRAVQVRTETFDDLGEVGEDPRWEVFYGFHAYLEQTFPLVHSRLGVDKVNTHGLLYTWTGSDAGLKPALLMAHQDTVPVPDDTVSSWEHPPFSGFFDGEYIWGRGSNDCKNQLIAVLESVELLLGAGFVPRRTLLLSFGFDEESFGFHGAGNLSVVIRERYGDRHDGRGLAVIIDEGATFESVWGTLFAKPGTAEKGSTNVEVTIHAAGGHSSIPHDHTTIGILSDFVTRVEAAQYPTHVDESNPYFAQLQCGAAHAAEFPPALRALLPHHSSADQPDWLAIEAAKQGPDIRYLLQTSQAVDLFHAGVKVNAQPETARAVINHRINIGDTTQIVYDRLTRIARDIAHKYQLSLHAFDGEVDAPNSIILVAPPGLETSPITPADGSVVSPFSVLAGSIRAVFGSETIVTPGIMTGNTDTRFFWDHTEHIFRFDPGYDAADTTGLEGIHTINEKVHINSHINAVKFFTLFIRNIDEAEL